MKLEIGPFSGYGNEKNAPYFLKKATFKGCAGYEKNYKKHQIVGKLEIFGFRTIAGVYLFKPV